MDGLLPKISYSDATSAWHDFRQRVLAVISEKEVKQIAEIGAGANPMLDLQFINDGGFSYRLYDESAEELNKAGEGFVREVIDFQSPLPVPLAGADLVVVQMTLEHIRYPEVFFRNVLSLLNEGGSVCLFYACATSLPMLSNRILPEWISHKLLIYAQPFRQNEKHGKFRAYYRWCYGPTSANIKRFRQAGFHISEYVGYFGHTYYRNIPWLDNLEKAKTRYLLLHPSPWLCTYAHVTLEAPDTAHPMIV